MAYQTIMLEKKEAVAVVQLNRPPMNPLNRTMYAELAQVSEELDADTGVKVVVITGSGDKAFAAGLDVIDVEGKSLVDIVKFQAFSGMASAKVAAIGKPVIAAINGLALGGGLELALRCDIRIASDKAILGQPEVNLGIIPGGGATQLLARLIGTARAKELFFTGDTIQGRPGPCARDRESGGPCRQAHGRGHGPRGRSREETGRRPQDDKARRRPRHQHGSRLRPRLRGGMFCPQLHVGRRPGRHAGLCGEAKAPV